MYLKEFFALCLLTSNVVLHIYFSSFRNSDLKYMLLIDSTVADHYVHKYPCDLVTFGVARSKGYGFAFRCV